MTKGLRKHSSQGNVYGAGTLTFGVESVPGVMPRAGHNERTRLRNRALEFAMMDPTVVQYMTSQRKKTILLEAFATIRELQAELKKLKGAKVPVN